MNRTERLEEQLIEDVLERERVGSHPIGHRAVEQVVESVDGEEADS